MRESQLDLDVICRTAIGSSTCCVLIASIRMILPIQEMGSGDYMFIALSDGFVEYR